ncbi:DsbA family protein [Vibrio sp. NTOU-M3]|uniref:DsbA family protein n=1 Tax=Vibrio sp. NTOU-M3 TaxID=3234954 RepID=UPI00349F2252
MKRIFILLLSVTALFSTGAFAQNDTDQKIEQIVTMLKENPDVIDGLYESLAMYIKQTQQFEMLLKSSQSYINDASHPTLGDANPKLTIVNMTDFSCPYCKKLDPVLERIVKDVKGVKVVNLLVPLKEQGSDISSASYALNVWKHDKAAYAKVSELLLKKPGAHNSASLKKIAKATGTEQYLKVEDESESVVKRNYGLFSAFGMRGTPAMIIGDQVLPGYVPYEQLIEVVKSKLEQS